MKRKYMRTNYKYPRVFGDSHLNSKLDFENAVKLFKTYDVEYQCGLGQQLLNNKQYKFRKYGQKNVLPELVKHPNGLYDLLEFIMDISFFTPDDEIYNIYKDECEGYDIPLPFDSYLTHKSIKRVKDGKSNKTAVNRIIQQINNIYGLEIAHILETQYPSYKSTKYFDKKEKKGKPTTKFITSIFDRDIETQEMVNSKNNISFSYQLFDGYMTAKSVMDIGKDLDEKERADDKKHIVESMFYGELKKWCERYDTKALKYLDKIKVDFERKGERVKNIKECKESIRKPVELLHSISECLTRMEIRDDLRNECLLHYINIFVKNVAKYLNNNQQERLFLSHREFAMLGDRRALDMFRIVVCSIITELKYDANNKMC